MRVLILGVGCLLCVHAIACDQTMAVDAGRDADIALDDGGGPDAARSDAAVSDGGTADAPIGDTSPDAGPAVDPLDGIGTVELVSGGFMFIEGPLWREADGVLLFSDIPAATIRALTPPSTIEVFRTASGESNGLASLPDGRLLAAEHANRRVSVTALGGAITDLAAMDAMGNRFNSPNDLAVRSDGTVYFTDPPYGLAGRMREIAFNGVFRISPAGVVSVVWMGTLAQRPNGIGLSPDETTLYVADTVDGVVRAFPVMPDGSTGAPTTLTSEVPGADGLAIDTAGNLFVTSSDGVRVFAPDGTRWGTIAVPMQPANCAFGEADHRTLYITARTALYRVRLTIEGRI